MALPPAAYGLSLLAGLLSTLSPCVLPLLPILFGAAAGTRPRAPFVLALGLALSYAVTGTLTAWAAAAIGMQTGLFRQAGAVFLAALGLVLLSPRLQQRFATATAAVSNRGQFFLAGRKLDGNGGAFIIGLALAVVWTPCVGPTLGVAILLASQGEHLPQIALLMALFGLGAALPIAGLGMLSRAALNAMRGRLLWAGRHGKTLLGSSLIVIAALILTGADRPLETWLLAHSPDGLTTLTTRY